MQASSFLKNTIVIFSNRALVILTNLLVMIGSSHLLDTATYGQIQTFWLQTSVFATIIGLGLATFLFSYTQEKIVAIWHTLSMRFKYGIGAAIFMLSAIYVIVQYFTNAAFYNHFGVGIALWLYILCFSVGLVLDALSVIFNKQRWLILTSVGNAVIYGIGHWGFLQQYWDSDVLIVVLAFGAIAKCALLLKSLQPSFQENTISEPIHLSSIYKHWLHLGVYDIFQMVFRFLDKFILSLLITKSLLAIYTNATYEIPVFSIVFVAVQNASLGLMQRKDTSPLTIATVIKQTSFLLGIFCIAATIFFLFNASSFISIVFSEKYLVGLPLFYIACLKIPVYMFNVLGFYQLKELGNLLVKHTYIDFVVTLLLAIPLYYFGGLEGLSIALLLGSYVFVALNVLKIKKVTNQKIVTFLPIKEWGGIAVFFTLLNFVLLQLIHPNVYFNETLVFFIKLIINAVIGFVLLVRFKKQFKL